MVAQICLGLILAKKLVAQFAGDKGLPMNCNSRHVDGWAKTGDLNYYFKVSGYAL